MDSFPSAEQALQFHLRLCDADMVVSGDICRAYVAPLLAWLERTFPRVDSHLRLAAIHAAIVDYLSCPAKYDPEKGDLSMFLRLSARSDLCNNLRGEKRHHRKRVDWSAVEDDAVAGNLSGREEDPAERLQAAEETERWQAFLRSLKETFTPEEERVLELILTGERNYRVYAQALGVEGLPVEEQDRAVKRAKDRVKKRLERKGQHHD